MCALLANCASHKVQYKNEYETIKQLPLKEIHRTFYLIGDAGKSPKDDLSTALKIFKKHVSKGSSKEDYALFLGDNVYPSGLPDEDDKNRDSGENYLNAQINAVKNFKGKTIFLPGNHDWYADGVKGVKREENYIEDALGKNTFKPENGCPLETINVSETVALFIIDTQWYLEDWDKNPTINDDCPIKTRKRFLEELEGELKKAQNKRVVFAMHHPMFTNGLHGGFYSAEKHIYPFQSKIPLPIIGSIITQVRTQGGISIQDRYNERYNELMKRLETLAVEYDNIVFVSGHEHTLQYIENGTIKQVISGSGAKEAVVALNNNGLFAYGQQGFAQLTIYKDGSTWVSFYGDDNGNPKLLYAKEVLKKRRELFDTNTLPDSFPTSIEASIYTKKETDKSNFYEALLGNRYREIYSTKIKVPVATLDTLYGGLDIIRPGGGHQTKSLRLKRKDGRELNMRALRKSATRYLQTVLFKNTHIDDDFDKTYIEKLILDFYTAAHPYAFFVIPDLSNAAGVYHTNPHLFYIPKHKYLGDYNTDYGNELYMIEERPEENYSNKKNFGYADDLESTHDIISKIRKDEKYKIDEEAYIRARLFDMLIGDWDRHQDQWRWAQFDQKNGDKLFRPIPRDRDQAFSNFDGALLDVMRSLSGSTNQLQVYDSELKDVKWMNSAGTKLDKVLIQQSNIDVWIQQAQFLQENITDEVITKAFSKIPEEVRDKSLVEIQEHLKGRRANIKDIAERYYNYLNKLVILTGTDKDDFIEITRRGNMQTTVKMSRIIDGKKGEVFLDRTFSKKITKEIWIYGLDDDDVFEVLGKAEKPIHIRIIGGQNHDVYTIKNGNRIRIYDYKSKENTILKNNGGKINFADRYNNNLFDFNKDIIYTGSITPTLNYNPDDGFILGISKISTKKGFQRNPFTRQHKINAGYYFATSGVSISYNGEFANFFGDWNLQLSGKMTSENFSNNFFGYGNETINNDHQLSLDYNRVKTSTYAVSLGLIKKGVFGSDYGLKIETEAIKVRKTDDRFIETVYSSDINRMFYKRHFFSGLESYFKYESYDNKITPTRALTFKASTGFKTELSEAKKTYGYLNTKLGFYNAISKNRKLVLKTYINSQFRIGKDLQFYQASNIGGNSGLRGFRTERFTGQNALVTSSDLRYAFNSFKTNTLPLQIGVFVGGDVGRVWLKGDNSKKWHNDYGGGLWVSAAESIQGTFSFFNSKEGLRFSFGFGLNL
ncbi:calcineurin-like phosphoesterase family protein [Tenacibaculum adriaticum]|uniref:Calcineurin-like phosphoesterase family protein n=2 Tax=Tenacibaculum adriaticum TaxID=413713 RepID=A0A5S5DR16_9FLAO|nr:calcineurin-like phosphoesterase family protein [Tenacibaculum adriaticum]